MSTIQNILISTIVFLLAPLPSTVAKECRNTLYVNTGEDLAAKLMPVLTASKVNDPTYGHSTVPMWHKPDPPPYTDGDCIQISKGYFSVNGNIHR